MTFVELYTKGAKVWIPHAEKVWEGAELLENYSPSKSTLQVKTEDGDETRMITIKTETDLPYLRNPSILVGENDLTLLSYLHEPAVLYNLQVRFCQQRDIYTYCGIVLVAINPYHDLPIYDSDTIHTYRGQKIGDLDPHIFAVSEDAYTKLEREQRDQSIIVSGESGAGKTVSAKYAMRYFATVGGSTTEKQIERKVLASSPIMEAIGNAKTTRNDNSSRFGKFIELQFNKHYHLIGSSMRTYLLEKSRVVFQTSDERNYHIFYQLCSARERYPHLRLREQGYYHYLNQGNSPYIDGVNDLNAFEETVNAMSLLGFSEIEQSTVFRVLAAVLHLGNINILEAIISSENELDQEGCGIPDSDSSLEEFSGLLEINKNQMRQWLCTKGIVSMRDTILKPMSVEQAITSRDALAKYIYAELFQWIVAIINKALETDIPRHKFIGVLDIYGFETFKINSFEQFCINYANEKLQQQFNLHVFKLEQEEYIREEIEWNMIDFYDNQLCIDLVESKLGILDLLDEECRMPRGSDETWTEKLYSKCKQYSHFAKARFGTSAFIINHYADKVQYESSGFLEKNRDTVVEEQILVIKSSKNNNIQRLFSDDSKKLPIRGTKLKLVSARPAVETRKTHKKTVGSQFRDSLNLLMATLNATTPHYVRCIKPNDMKKAFEYNPQRAVQQLRACGVLETITISAAGFPSRWAYVDFFYRYRVLCEFKDINWNDMKLTCETILKQYIQVPEMYKFGKTKIFFRAGQVAYLEKLRVGQLRHCCIIMQSTVRAFICRKKYLRITKSVYNIQRYCRGNLARRLADNFRRNNAATTIQRYVRGWMKKSQYKSLHRLVQLLQSYARGYLARKKLMEMKYNAKAIVIQKYLRGWLASKHYKKLQKQVIICQAAIRRFLARLQYKKLKIEARFIQHVKKLNKGLENKIISLQQKIEKLNKTNNELKLYRNETVELRNKLVTSKTLEIDIKNLNNLLMEKNKIIVKLEEEIKIEKDEKMDLLQELEKYQFETNKQRELRDQETTKLQKEFDNLNEIVLSNQKDAEEKLKVRIEEEKYLLINEYDSDRQAYQKLVQDYHCLEQHCDTLEIQLNGHSCFNTHMRNISDVSSISAVDDWSEGADEISSGTSKRSNDQNVDVGLVLQLQHKLAETEKFYLRKGLDELELLPKFENAENAAKDALRIAQLELENSNLKTQLFELTDSIKDGNGKGQLTVQNKALQEELERRGEEIIQLKGVLANQTENIKSIVNCHPRTGEYINEVGKLALAYETQKTINKQLKLELQDEKTRYKANEKEFIKEIEKLREDNGRQQRLLSANLSTSLQSQTKAFMQHEITKFTPENLNLHDQTNALNETIRKLKKQIKLLNKKLKDCGLDFEENEFTILYKDKNEENTIAHEEVTTVKKIENDYLGMFSFKSGDENVIMKHLVTELKPRTAFTLLPGLPAYIVFMCVRHTDYINDEDKVRALLSAFRNSVRKVAKKRHKDFETMVLWLSSTLRLVHCMKQYSGDKSFQKKNSAKQNSQSLRNFDLSEYRQVLSDNAVWIYQGLLHNIQETIQPLIVPAILEHEEVPGIGGNKLTGVRDRTISLRDIDSPGRKQKPIVSLLDKLTNYQKILTFYGVDPEVISQIFKQVFYFLCASSLNNLLLRKELCHWSKGLQVRHNVSHFEMWTHEKQLDTQAIQSTLQPIIQAANLLQARRSEEHVASVCEMCSALTPLQICKILNLYTPMDEFEQRVPAAFITKVQAKLQERPNYMEQQTLLMDTTYLFPVRFPFNPSVICLEDIEIPEVLKLPMLEKV